MFRSYLLAAASATALALSAATGFAADLPAYEPPAEAVVAVPSFTWTGAYVGAQAGYAFGSAGRLDPEGLVVGGYAGYNVQLDNSPLVFGIETDFNYTDVDDSAGLLGSRVKAETKWAGATRARIGYAFDRFLVYGAAGVAYADREISVSGFGKDSKTALGWTVGGGAEYAVTDNLLARVDYRYSDYGSDKFGINGVGRVRSDYDEHRVMGGLAYKFDFGF